MEITEININITSEEVRRKDGVYAFVRVTFDRVFTVRDMKLLVHNGAARLGMPSRKAQEPCSSCRLKVDLTSRYCSNCGSAHVSTVGEGTKVHLDVAHPLNQDFRNYLEQKVVAFYNAKVPVSDQLQLRSDHDG